MKKETTLIISLIVLAVASRLLPHPPNFAPITGIALFGAAKFSKKIIAFLLPLVCLFVTDLFLGISWINVFVYTAFAMITFMGLRQKSLHLPTVFYSSILFFVVSNMGVWLLHYPLTVEGLMTCFTLAIPFYTNTLAGDLFYTLTLFYTFSFVQKVYLKINLDHTV